MELSLESCPILNTEIDAPPPGFRQLTDRAEIESAIGPFYIRQVAAGRLQLGFRVTQGKLNAMGVCHGGVLATFADIQGTALKISHDLWVQSPTMNLSMDFMAPAPAGAWVQSEPELVRQTGTMLFFQALVRADEMPCLRVSGIYRLMRHLPMK